MKEEAMYQKKCVKSKALLKYTIKKGLNQKVNLGYWNLSCQKKLSKVDATAVVDAQCDRSVVCSAQELTRVSLTGTFHEAFG